MTDEPAHRKVSDLGHISDLDGSEIVMVIRNGQNFRSTVAHVRGAADHHLPASTPWWKHPATYGAALALAVEALRFAIK